MNLFILHYDPLITQKGIDILATYLRSFGSIEQQSVRNHYLKFRCDLTLKQIQDKLAMIHKIKKIEAAE